MNLNFKMSGRPLTLGNASPIQDSVGERSAHA